MPARPGTQGSVFAGKGHSFFASAAVRSPTVASGNSLRVRVRRVTTAPMTRAMRVSAVVHPSNARPGLHQEQFEVVTLDEGEFEQFRASISLPLLANMTEFGKSPLLTASQLESLGYNIVIYPVTALRLAMRAASDGLRSIRETGAQNQIIDAMQTRAELYELLRYEDYNQFDETIFNFKLPASGS